MIDRFPAVRWVSSFPWAYQYVSYQAWSFHSYSCLSGSTDHCLEGNLHGQWNKLSRLLLFTSSSIIWLNLSMSDGKALKPCTFICISRCMAMISIVRRWALSPFAGFLWLIALLRFLSVWLWYFSMWMITMTLAFCLLIRSRP